MDSCSSEDAPDFVFSATIRLNFNCSYDQIHAKLMTSPSASAVLSGPSIWKVGINLDRNHQTHIKVFIFKYYQSQASQSTFKHLFWLVMSLTCFISVDWSQTYQLNWPYSTLHKRWLAHMSGESTTLIKGTVQSFFLTLKDINSWQKRSDRPWDQSAKFTRVKLIYDISWD